MEGEREENGLEKLIKILWGKIPYERREKAERRLKKDLQNQYTEPESKIQERMEHFFIKQGKILLLEMITGSLFLIILLGSFFIPKPLVLSRNPFGEGTKEIALSLKKDKQRKKIILQMGEMRLSSGEAERIYQEFFKKLEKKISGKNA